MMRTLDVIIAVFLVIGGVNWGLIGFFNFNLVTTIFSEMPALIRFIYSAVGLSAIYQILQWKAIQKRWKIK